MNEAKAVAAAGCDPVPSGFESRRSPHLVLCPYEVSRVDSCCCRDSRCARSHSRCRQSTVPDDGCVDLGVDEGYLEA